MGPSALSQSGTVIRPKSLSERLAVETPAEPEAMAELLIGAVGGL